MADKSSIIRDAVVDLKRFQTEAVELAKQELLSQAKSKIEEKAKVLFENMLFEGEEESTEDEAPKVSVEITVPSEDEASVENTEDTGTYVDSSSDFHFADDNENNEENIEETTMENNTENDVNLVDSPDMDAIIREYLDMADSDEVAVEEVPAEVAAEEVPVTETTNIDGLESAEAPVADETLPTGEETFTPLTEEEIAQLEAELDEELNRLDEKFNFEKDVVEKNKDKDSEDKKDCDKEEEKKKDEKEVIDEENAPAEDETPIEEASMQSTTHLRHKNAKPVNVEKKADSMNEARELYAKLANEVNGLINENKTEKAKNAELLKLNESLTAKLKDFKDKLYEASVITSKTAFVNRLFLEHTTTQDQKKAIVNAFTKAGSRDEVKALYESYNTQLGSTIINEGIENKIGKVIAEGANPQSNTANNIVHGVDISKYKRIMNYNSK